MINLPHKVNDLMNWSHYLNKGEARFYSADLNAKRYSILRKAIFHIKDFYDEVPKQTLSYVWNVITSEYDRAKMDIKPKRKLMNCSIDILLTPKGIAIAHNNKDYFKKTEKDYIERRLDNPVCNGSENITIEKGTMYAVNTHNLTKKYTAKSPEKKYSG